MEKHVANFFAKIYARDFNVISNKYEVSKPQNKIIFSATEQYLFIYSFAVRSEVREVNRY